MLFTTILFITIPYFSVYWNLFCSARKNVYCLATWIDGHEWTISFVTSQSMRHFHPLTRKPTIVFAAEKLLILWQNRYKIGCQKWTILFARTFILSTFSSLICKNFVSRKNEQVALRRKLFMGHFHHSHKSTTLFTAEKTPVSSSKMS